MPPQQLPCFQNPDYHSSLVGSLKKQAAATTFDLKPHSLVNWTFSPSLHLSSWPEPLRAQSTSLNTTKGGLDFQVYPAIFAVKCRRLQPGSKYCCHAFLATPSNFTTSGVNSTTFRFGAWSFLLHFLHTTKDRSRSKSHSPKTLQVGCELRDKELEVGIGAREFQHRYELILPNSIFFLVDSYF